MVLKIKETVNAIDASLVEKGMVGMMCQSFLQQLPLQTPVDMPTSTQTTFVDVVTLQPRCQECTNRRHYRMESDYRTTKRQVRYQTGQGSMQVVYMDYS